MQELPEALQKLDLHEINHIFVRLLRDNFANLNQSLIDGYFTPVSSNDASAPRNTIYYSTTASKLVYKNSAGVVNALY